MRWTRITEKEIGLLDGISGFAIRLYLRLKLYAGSENYAWPSQTRIAKEMGVTRQMVSKNIQKLGVRGLVKREGKRFLLPFHPDKHFDRQVYHSISSKRVQSVNQTDDKVSIKRMTNVVQTVAHNNNNKKNMNITLRERDKILEKDELLIADLLEWYPDLPKGLAVIAARWLEEEWCLIAKRTIEDSPVTRNPVAVFISKLKDTLGGDPSQYNAIRLAYCDLDGKPISHENTIKRMVLKEE